MRRTLLTAILTLLTAVPSGSRVLDVPSDFPTIAEGLSAALPADTVRVACGVYTESGLLLGPGVTLLGAAIDSTCTVIDGVDGSSPILTIDPGGTDCVVHGLTFRNGNAQRGGAIFMSYAATPGPTLSHCRFENNRASDNGGAVYSRYLRIEGCAFVGNQGAFGGALWCLASQLTNCTFEGNLAAEEGGAGYLGGSSIEECVFVENRSVRSGGAVLMGNGQILRTLFEANVAGSSGGGVKGSGVTITDCVFRADSCRSSGGGASASGRITGCLFVGNHARGGGGLEYGGILGVAECRFIANTAAENGGAVAHVGDGAVESCTFLGNGAANGGGLYTSRPSPLLRRCVIQESTSGGATAHYVESFPVFDNCDFFGNVGGEWTGHAEPYFAVEGNISADGLFCDTPPESGYVSSASPLLPDNNALGVVIGAVSAGCAPTGVVVTTIPPGLSVTVDGITAPSPLELDWSIGSFHTLEVPASIPVGEGVRQTFLEWSDGGEPSHTVTAPAAPASFVARFRTEFFVTTESDPHGTVAPPTGWFARGPITVTAQAESLYQHVGWTGIGIGSYSGGAGAPEILVIAPITEHALLRYDGTYPLTVEAAEGGDVSPTSGEYLARSVVEIRATAHDGYIFDGWVGAGVGSYTGPNPIATVRMDGPITEIAGFHYAGYTTVATIALGGGAVEPPSGTYPRELPLTIRATPGPGFTFYRWVGEGDGAYTGPEREWVVVPLGPLKETAYFAAGGRFPLSVEASPDGIVSPPSGEFDAGCHVTLSAIARSGWVFREWHGTGLGSYSGPDAFPTITMHSAITEVAQFEPDGALHGYELSISASGTDPFLNVAPPAAGPRALYLWITCSESGISAFEAGVRGTLTFSDFTPDPGTVNFGIGTDLLLGILDCPTGSEVARRLGSWTALDTGGQVWLTTSRTNGIFGAVDCGPFPVIWSDPRVHGFSSSGPAPVTGTNGCDMPTSVDVTQLAAVPGNRCVILTWTASGAPSHAGYHVYRGDDTDGPFERLTKELLQPESPHRYEDHGCRGDHRYAYRVGAVAADGSEEIVGPVVVTTPQWAPLVTALSGVVPNPFRDSTELRFSLAAPGPARLSVYDVGGRLVRVLCDGELPAGDHVVTWKAGTGSLRASAGIYFVRLETGERRVTKRVVLLGSTR